MSVDAKFDFPGSEMSMILDMLQPVANSLKTTTGLSILFSVNPGMRTLPLYLPKGKLFEHSCGIQPTLPLLDLSSSLAYGH